METDIEKGIAALRTLKDELRVQMHLAGLEAKERWKKLEPKVQHAEKVARDATTASKKVLEDAISQLRELKESVRRE